MDKKPVPLKGMFLPKKDNKVSVVKIFPASHPVGGLDRNVLSLYVNNIISAV